MTAAYEEERVRKLEHRVNQIELDTELNFTINKDGNVA